MENKTTPKTKGIDYSNKILEVKNLKVGYGKIIAVKDISITVNQGEIVTLIGSNGAGKSCHSREILK